MTNTQAEQMSTKPNTQTNYIRYEKKKRKQTTKRKEQNKRKKKKETQKLALT